MVELLRLFFLNYLSHNKKINLKTEATQFINVVNEKDVQKDLKGIYQFLELRLSGKNSDIKIIESSLLSLVALSFLQYDGEDKSFYETQKKIISFLENESTNQFEKIALFFYSNYENFQGIHITKRDTCCS
mgnify:FL=1